MFTTCTVPEPAAFVAAPFSAAGLPHAASSPPAPLTAASVPADRVTNARRVERPPPMSPVCITIVVSSRLQVLALVLSIVEACQGIRNRLSKITARYSRKPKRVSTKITANSVSASRLFRLVTIR